MILSAIYCVMVVLLSFGVTYGVAMLALCAFRERRRHFALKYIIFVVLLLALVVMFNLGYFLPVFPALESLSPYISLIENQLKIPLLLFIMAYTVAGCAVIYKLPFKDILFFATTAYLIQHIPVTIYSTLLSLGVERNIYIFGLIYVVFYAIMYFTVVRRVWREEVDTNNISLVICAALSAIIIFVFEFVSALNIGATAGLYQTISCVIMLILSFGFFRESKIKKEKEKLQYLLQVEQKHYDDLRESMDIINIRCHDLKYQLLDLQNKMDETDSKALLGKIRDEVDIYGNLNFTDCEPLNVILADKQLLCGKYGIQLYCIADGRLLDFMQAQDIYSLFGNALDNAIEYLQTVDDINKRTIYLKITSVDKAISVHVENYFEGQLQYDSGKNIVSRKVDKSMHGFGLKSIKYIAEKYGGVLSVSDKDNAFSLNLIFPR